MSFRVDGRLEQESTKCKNRREAEKCRALRISEVMRGVFVKETNATLEQLGERFMQHAKLHKRSWLRDEQLLGDLKRFFGNPRLRDITTSRIEDFQKARSAEVSNATTNRATALLKRMYFLAEQWGLHSGNPVRFVRQLREDSFNPVTLSEEQEQRFLATAPEYIRDLVTLDLNTGLRKSDLFGLKWADVDMERRELRIVVKKNRKLHELPLNEAAFGVLEKQKRTGDFVFINPLTGRPIKDVRFALASAAKRAGLPKLNWHMCRHTIATRLLDITDAITVKEVLGHQSLNTTIKYTHPGRKKKQVAMELLRGGRVAANDNVAASVDNVMTMVPLEAVG